MALNNSYIAFVGFYISESFSCYLDFCD